MALISGGVVTLAFEDMPEMATAGRASDLCTAHEHRLVHMAVDGPRDGVEEGRPATTRFELGTTLVDGSSASPAVVDARRIEFVILSSSRSFSALLAEHFECLWAELCAPFCFTLGFGRHVSKVSWDCGGIYT